MDSEEKSVVVIFGIVAFIATATWMTVHFASPERVCDKRGHIFSPMKCVVLDIVPKMIVDDSKDSTIVYYHTGKDSMYECLRCFKNKSVYFNVKDSVVKVIKNKK